MVSSHADIEKVPPSFQILSSIPGRIRIRITDWKRFETRALEHRLRAVIGVQAVRVNRLTQNVLIWYGCPAGARERVLWVVDAVLKTDGPPSGGTAQPLIVM